MAGFVAQTRGGSLGRPESRRSWLAVILVAGSGLVAGADEVATPLEKAAALRSAGSLEEALDVLRTESREIKRIEGEQSTRLLPINELAADILVDQGKLETAATLLDKSLSAREKLAAGGKAEEQAALAQTLLVVARLRMAEKRFPDAVAAARRALASVARVLGPADERAATARKALQAAVTALDELLGPTDPATIAARTEAAAGFVSSGMLADAIDQRRAILTGVASGPGADADETASARHALCRLLLAAGRGDEAVAIVEKATSDDPATLGERRFLGELQIATDRLIAADATIEAVLEATRSPAIPNSVDGASDRLNQLLIAVRRGRAAGFPDWYEPALKLLVKPQPTDTPAAISALERAGDIALLLGKPAVAIESFTRALGLAETARPPSPAAIAERSARLAAAHLAAGDALAARKKADPALQAADAALGPGDPHVAELRVVLAEACRREDETERAVALAAAALEHGLPRPSQAWEEAVTAIYDRMPPQEGDESWPTRFAAARARQFGDGHPHVGMAWCLFGTARLAAGDWSSAASYLSRAVSLQEAALGDGSPDVAATLTLLAQAERAGGDPKRAAETAARAVAAWERSAGPTDPGTLAAIDVLVAARIEAGESNGVEPLLERLCSAGKSIDPVLRAGHLVRLADITARRDKSKAAAGLEEALALPCWADESLTDADRKRLAFTAARAARAYGLIGDQAAGQDALRKARSLALSVDGAKDVLERIEQLAAGGTEPAS